MDIGKVLIGRRALKEFFIDYHTFEFRGRIDRIENCSLTENKREQINIGIKSEEMSFKRKNIVTVMIRSTKKVMTQFFTNSRIALKSTKKTDLNVFFLFTPYNCRSYFGHNYV